MRASLLGDVLLNTGILNPGGQPDVPKIVDAGTAPGIVVRFAKPLVNRPGDDLVAFEIQRGDSPFSGDVLHVVPVDGAEGARPITLRSFDVTYDHTAAREVLMFTRYPLEKPTSEISSQEAAWKSTGNIQAASALHMEEKRFDMLGFRPNDHYINRMQAYGVLPDAPEAPIDVYATDEAYWRSFWYRAGKLRVAGNPR